MERGVAALAAAAAASTLAVSATAQHGAGNNGHRRRRALPVFVLRAAADGEAAGKGDDEVKTKEVPNGADDEVKRGEKVVKAKADRNPIEDFIYQMQNMSEEQQEDLKTFVLSLSFALFIRFNFIEPRFIPSLSMYPTFDIGDQLTVDKISTRWRDLQRRDVVVFNPPPLFNVYSGVDRTGEALIKRIIALEGDVVEVKNGGNLYINGEKQDEPFTNEKAKYDFGPVTVPKGCVLVLGDNRNASLDGHIWGPLPKENIIGRATLKFWPPWRVGTIAAAPQD